MTTQKLPTWPEITDSALTEATRAHASLSDALDWLRSDWAPVGTSLTDAAADARTVARRKFAQAKDLIDEAKNALRDGRQPTE